MIWKYERSFQICFLPTRDATKAAASISRPPLLWKYLTWHTSDKEQFHICGWMKPGAQSSFGCLHHPNVGVLKLWCSPRSQFNSLGLRAKSPARSNVPAMPAPYVHKRIITPGHAASPLILFLHQMATRWLYYIISYYIILNYTILYYNILYHIIYIISLIIYNISNITSIYMYISCLFSTQPNIYPTGRRAWSSVPRCEMRLGAGLVKLEWRIPFGRPIQPPCWNRSHTSLTERVQNDIKLHYITIIRLWITLWN